MPKWVEAGKSARALQTFMQESFGSAYRWENMLKDFREFTGLFKKEGLIRGLDPAAVAPRGYMVEHDLGRDYRYRAFFDADYEDALTGERRTANVSFYDDSLRSQDEWEDRFRDVLDDPLYGEGFEFKGLRLRSLEHNREWGY